MGICRKRPGSMKGDGRNENPGPQGVWGPEMNLTPIQASRGNLTLQKNYGMDEQGKDCPSVPAIAAGETRKEGEDEHRGRHDRADTGRFAVDQSRLPMKALP